MASEVLKVRTGCDVSDLGTCKTYDVYDEVF